MNREIQKIIDESNLAEIIDDTYLVRGDWHPFVEKFVELLLEECADLIDNKRIADMLREHFENEC